jgi:hypothetical protein
MVLSLPGETQGLHGVQFVQQWDIQIPFSLIIFLWGIKNAGSTTIKVNYIYLLKSLHIFLDDFTAELSLLKKRFKLFWS